MALVKTDIKLLKPERLQDTEDGGGRITANALVSGQENNLFDDISELSRVYGNISLRKFFVGITTNNTDRYYGAHAIISDIPDDPNVIATLFTTENWDDERSSARDYVERYLSRGTRWNGHLLERQITGQKAILIWQRLPVELPTIGSVFSLIANEGTANEYEQYVRITRISQQVRTYHDQQGSYQVNVLTIEISDPLLYDFVGIAPSRYDTGLNPAAIVRTTIAVDAARYYGTQPLALDAKTGDMNVTAKSIYNQIVPSAQSEIPAVDLSPGSQAGTVTSSQDNVQFTTSMNISPNIVMYLGNACTPGTLSITVTGGTLTDDGSDIKYNGTTVVGTIQYNQGILTFNTSCPTFTGTKTVVFRPAASVIRIANTACIEIDPQNRGYVYTITCHPTPSPGTLFIDYMSQGKWYRLYDKGNGVIKGADTSYGSGQVSYSTGSVILTCGALPDNYTKIIFYWSTPTSTFNRSNYAVTAPDIRFTLAHTPVAPTTYSVTANGISLTDNGLGVLSGSGGTGTIRYTTGEVVIKPTNTPLGGTTFTSAYNYGNPIEETFLHPARNQSGKIALALNNQNILEKTVEVEFNVLIDDYNAYTSIQGHFVPATGNWVDPIVISRDDGNGNLGIISDIDGTVNYAAGTLEFTPEQIVNIPKPIYSNHLMGTSTRPWRR